MFFVIVAASLLSCGALKVQHGDGNKKATWTAKVYVQDFLPGLFPRREIPGLRTLNLADKVGSGELLSPGDSSGFISNQSTAPSRFQIRKSADTSMAIGENTQAEDVARVGFDEFALEQIMLSKWLKKSMVCRDIACAREADVIVAPTVFFHALLAFGFQWATITNVLAGNVHLHLRYFKQLMTLYPSTKDKSCVFVLHSQFVNSSPKGLYDAMFTALAIFPKEAQKQFVIASVESNLGNRLSGIFGEDWSDGAQPQKYRRHMGTSAGGPLLVTMPYPLPVVAPMRWTHLALPRRRPYALLFMGSANKGATPGHKNLIRPVVVDAMQKLGESWTFRPDIHKGPMAKVHFSVVCSDKNAPAGANCGVGQDKSFWEQTANAEFCLQPPGDTLTRSHFYVSVLSGCIPIVFEGGHQDFEPHAPTWWAWRAVSGKPLAEFTQRLDTTNLWDSTLLWNATEFAQPFFRYEDFSIVAPAETLMDSANMTRFLNHVVAMPVEQPSRFKALRKGLDKIAPLMMYRTGVDPDYPDAFVAFESLIIDQARRSRVH